jgi:DNA replication protein DnaC
MMVLSDIAAQTVKDSRIERCERHGEYESRLLYAGKHQDYRTGCAQCAAESRAAAEAKRIADEAQAEIARKQATLTRRLDRACIPARFAGRSFANFIADSEPKIAALQAAQHFAETFAERKAEGSSLVFSGRPGTGKSHLACSIARAVIDGGCTALYATARDIIRMLRQTWERDAERTESDVLADLVRVDLLIVDELGVGFGSDAEKLQFFDVLDGRYREQRPIVVLTNLDRAGLSAFIGQRAYDRLREAGTWVPFDWDSYRGRAK